MGLTQALATSLSGLTATQASLGVVAGNVANAQTPGYIAQSVGQEATLSGDAGEGVRVTSINRVLDTFLQQQLRTESAGGAYADLRASFYQQLQQIYGQPGSDTSLDAVFNSFTSAVQSLSTSPSSFTAQNQTISAAQNLAQQLNDATDKSKRCAAKPTRASPTTSSRPTTRCSRSPTSISSWRAARPRTARRLCWRTSAINISISFRS